MTLVENEFRGDEVEKGRLPLDSPREFLKGPVAALAFGAGEGDVGVKGPGLGNESTKRGTCDNALGERGERGRGVNLGKEDAGTIEDAQLAKVDGNGRGLHLREALDEARILLRRGVGEELKCNVPGVGSCPAQIVRAGAEPRRQLRKLVQDHRYERDANE